MGRPAALIFFYVGQGRRTYRVFHKWFRRKSNQKLYLLDKKESNYFQVPSSRQRLCREAEQCYPVRQHHLRLSGEQCVHECENGVSSRVRHSHRTLSGIVGLSGMALIVIVWLVYCKDPWLQLLLICFVLWKWEPHYTFYGCVKQCQTIACITLIPHCCNSYASGTLSDLCSGSEMSRQSPFTREKNPTLWWKCRFEEGVGDSRNTS